MFISTAATGFEVKNGGGKERLPARYNATTELHRTVEKGGSHTFNFDLESAGEIVQPTIVDDEGEVTED